MTPMEDVGDALEPASRRFWIATFLDRHRHRCRHILTSTLWEEDAKPWTLISTCHSLRS
jgi:hypothetical protein